MSFIEVYLYPGGESGEKWNTTAKRSYGHFWTRWGSLFVPRETGKNSPGLLALTLYTLVSNAPAKTRGAQHFHMCLHILSSAFDYIAHPATKVCNSVGPARLYGDKNPARRLNDPNRNNETWAHVRSKIS